jgi:hypothetical protein
MSRLDFHHIFRRKNMHTPIDVRLKLNSLLSDLSIV